MVAVAMVTKVQNGHQIKKSSDLGEIWFPSRIFGNHISPKSEAFCILVAILYSKWPPYQTNDGYQFATS
jgi:hypothetical protein